LARLPAPLKPAAMLLQQTHMGISPNNALQPTPSRFALRLPRSLRSIGAAERGRWTAFAGTRLRIFDPSK
jgi:hypothetical protein